MHYISQFQILSNMYLYEHVWLWNMLLIQRYLSEHRFTIPITIETAFVKSLFDSWSYSVFIYNFFLHMAVYVYDINFLLFRSYLYFQNSVGVLVNVDGDVARLLPFSLFFPFPISCICPSLSSVSALLSYLRKIVFSFRLCFWRNIFLKLAEFFDTFFCMYLSSVCVQMWLESSSNNQKLWRIHNNNLINVCTVKKMKLFKESL